ncbi:glyoxalase domain-containing protein 4-like isoform X2 [Cimex lectularius]|uniref:Uncharacterized protein n=1 Tax=Cimex lectularius TaxID=79782 RepID=A0A8I6TD04_CIMLE|nr:glyoxalase domain-containing protein 4-like isoform X2 [Cimex lectularius]XP_014240548.1 glyoxalase domain-containing protein 4-like isoform X2 [Cimex lectularius]
MRNISIIARAPNAKAWSKTVFGYFPEHKSFTLEVHCCMNTGPPLKEYQLVGFTIKSSEILKRAKVLDEPIYQKKHKFILNDSDGRQFVVLKKRKKPNKDPLVKITLRSTNLKKTLDYWHCQLGMLIFSKKKRSVVVGYNVKGVKLKFVLATKQIYRGKGYLKIAAPLSFIQKLGEAMKTSNNVITMPLTHLRVNNLVAVNFMLLSDPDAHLICFIDDKGFEKMAVANPNANKLLNAYIDRQSRMKKLESLSEENFQKVQEQNKSDSSFP